MYPDVDDLWRCNGFAQGPFGINGVQRRPGASCSPLLEHGLPLSPTSNVGFGSILSPDFKAGGGNRPCLCSVNAHQRCGLFREYRREGFMVVRVYNDHTVAPQGAARALCLHVSQRMLGSMAAFFFHGRVQCFGRTIAWRPSIEARHDPIDRTCPCGGFMEPRFASSGALLRLGAALEIILGLGLVVVCLPDASFSSPSVAAAEPESSLLYPKAPLYSLPANPGFWTGPARSGFGFGLGGTTQVFYSAETQR